MLYVLCNSCFSGVFTLCLSCRYSFFLTYAADDDFKLIVGLGVGLSLFFLTVLVVILIVVYIRVQRRKKEGSLSSDDNSEWVLLVLQLFSPIPSLNSCTVYAVSSQLLRPRWFYLFSANVVVDVIIVIYIIQVMDIARLLKSRLTLLRSRKKYYTLY